MNAQPNWQEIVAKLLEHRTQPELSKLTGVPQSTISQLLNGKPRKRLTFDNGMALLERLKIDKQQPPPNT
ncbi:helix-turn-helix domain-containing protein [Moraxella nonliquefaciens]|jgi:DNA-binding helix-turn-helix protein|uniref:helix-turn-helix domain-containing protein n=1 Tax=Moraxella nonliquefaciens TaxID=478 RepID=UPI001EF682E2|nr:helix-turn-helix transcriptional regulator [Moraxella nonliquefaciens]MCG7412265.1 helix-turn-helix domain-containing protein [Moraxella nonliquefaciens]MDI4498753.1 XRE family transcriptional regulator [Moraxella nonliquefaciens]MDI4500555.1 XRE family transcriptional regulator [Moraxella nonliquefaciens]